MGWDGGGGSVLYGGKGWGGGGGMLASWDAQSHGPFSSASVGSEHEADQ